MLWLVTGAEIKISRPVEDKNPVVIARLGRDDSKRTVTFYGHYDVQPAMEREWVTDPFEMNAIDGYYYGRGTSDNKVCLVHQFCSFVKRHIEACIKLQASTKLRSPCHFM